MNEKPMNAVQASRYESNLELIRQLTFLKLSLEHIVNDLENGNSPLIDMRPLGDFVKTQYPQLKPYDYIIGDWGLTLIQRTSRKYHLKTENPKSKQT